MLLWTISSLSLAFSFSVILASSPLSLGLWILTLAVLLSCSVSFSFSSWFALVIFLIYIGGMLVMFAYFTALMPNLPLEMSKMLSMLFITVLIVMASLFSSKALLHSFSYNSTSPVPSLLYSYNLPVFLFMAIILFFVLVAVVKVANIYKGPLRPFN